MKNKTIFITGAGSGIGKDSAFELAEKGHTIIASVETESQKVSLVEEVKKSGFSIEVIKIDIIKKEERELIKNYNLDVLINVAGIGESGSLAEIDMQRVRDNFEVNVFSTLELSQIALQKMMKKKEGRIIFVSSVAGRMPTPFLSPYSMTKYALSGGVAAMREEIYSVAPDVHMVLVEPGAYATGFNQEMFAKKYKWMNENSFFWTIVEKLKKQDKSFENFEVKSTKSIVEKIVKAVEAKNPKTRYVAPLYQSIYVQIKRIFGQ